MVAGRTREVYGVNWPATLTDLEIELICYRDNHGTRKGGMGREKHFRNAVAILWPDLKWNHWLNDAVAAWCNFEVIGLTGGAAAGKTFSAALCSLVDWLSSPMDTTVILTSTTVPALRKRVWGDVKKLWNAVPGLPGNLVDSSNRLEAYKGNDRSAMFGIAVKDGSVEKAVGNIQGVHNQRVIVVIDEMPQTPKAIVTAASNLSKGTKFFRFVGIGNAVSRFDQHGRMCEPIGGWSTVNECMPYWLTKGGICLHFDGLQSPNIVESEPMPVELLYASWSGHRRRSEFAAKRKRLTEMNADSADFDALNEADQKSVQSAPAPEDLHQQIMANADPVEIEKVYVRAIGKPVEHPYLTTANQVSDEEQRTSRDSVEWWMYVRGFWPPDGILKTVFTQTIIAKLPESTLWREEQELVAGLDPAFGGGDRCVLSFGKIGVFLGNGLPGLFCMDSIEIRPKVSSSEPVHFQIAQRVIEECKRRNVRPDCFAMDSTGEGGGLADIITKTWPSPKIHRVEFGGSASDMVISRYDNRKAKLIYSNRVTELWFTARQFAMNLQICGLDDDTAIELVSREYKLVNKTYTVESKTDMKARTGRSPDLADSFAVLCWLMRLRGILPGSATRTGLLPTGGDSSWVQKCREHDVYSR
jgi:hypothetical protein